MNITQEQAQEWLENAIPGPWDAFFDDKADATRLYKRGEDEEIEDTDSWELARNAPDLAQTIAGMTEQWGVRADDEEIWADTPDQQMLVEQAAAMPGNHLLRRLVGPVEVVE